MGIIYGFIIEDTGKWPYVPNMNREYPAEDIRDAEFTGEVNSSGFKIVREVTGTIYKKNTGRTA